MFFIYVTIIHVTVVVFDQELHLCDILLVLLFFVHG
jgi:hypothetical protein